MRVGRANCRTLSGPQHYVFVSNSLFVTCTVQKYGLFEGVLLDVTAVQKMTTRLCLEAVLYVLEICRGG